MDHILLFPYIFSSFSYSPRWVFEFERYTLPYCSEMINLWDYAGAADACKIQLSFIWLFRLVLHFLPIANFFLIELSKNYGVKSEETKKSN